MFSRYAMTAMAIFAVLHGPQASAANVYEQVSERIACLSSQMNGSRESIGTGFFVAPGILATARHQIEGARSVTVHLTQGGRQSARVVAVDKKNDTALIRIAVPGPSPLPLAKAQPALGDAVFTVGCPLGLSHTLTRGVVSHPARQIQGATLIQSDLAINQGNSGGPLVNARGEVVGVIHGRFSEANGLNFAVPVKHVGALLAQAAPDTPLQSGPAPSGDAESRARHYLQRIMALPWDATAYYNLGLIRLNQGRHAEARELFEQASLKKSPYPEALNNLALAQWRLGKPTEARDSLLRAVSQSPAFALTFLNLGVVYEQGLRDAHSARASYQRYLQLAPNAAQAARVRQWLKNHPSPQSAS